MANNKILRFEFEYRIFISLSIVIMVVLCSTLLFRSWMPIVVKLGTLAGLDAPTAFTLGYYAVAIIIALASLLRMWAGSILSSATVMSFRVQDSRLIKQGPYLIVRNPIYLADLIAFFAFSLLLPVTGLIMPLLIYLHYRQLIIWEEKNLRKQFPSDYTNYINSAPRLFPAILANRNLKGNRLRFYINFDGFRHNAQYVLFIPGLIVAGNTGKFIHLILIGLPAVIDWIVIHTIIGLKPEKKEKQLAKKRIKPFDRSGVFTGLLYAQGWEDPRPDFKALKIKKGDTIFTITSGGCNALAYLVKAPGRIICLDMNERQNHLMALKIAAFRMFDHSRLLQFMGVTECLDRVGMYDGLSSLLGDKAREFWNDNLENIRDGIIHAGRYERYMKLLKQLFYVIVGKHAALKIFSIPENERLQFYEKHWNNLRWKIFTRIFLSKKLMVRRFDKRFYSYLESGFDFNAYYRAAIKRAVTELPARNNNFLNYILRGTYTPDSLPVYLQEENFNTIRNNLDAIETVNGKCYEFLQKLPDNTIDQFNFTNIFEWMSIEEYTAHLKECLRTGKNGSVIIYRNHLVTRRRPEELSKWIVPDRKLSEELHRQDLSFIYKDYVIERISKKNAL